MGKYKKAKYQKPGVYSQGTIHIYTDGSHRPPDNSTLAFLLFSEGRKEVIKAERHACRGGTINEMELEAINRGLDHPGLTHVVIHSDSAYAIGCLSVWRRNWALNNWMLPSGLPVKNRDVIRSAGEKMDKLQSVTFMKVKAHSGDPFNSIVDFLAQGLSIRMRDDNSIIDLRETW